MEIPTPPQDYGYAIALLVAGIAGFIGVAIYLFKALFKRIDQGLAAQAERTAEEKARTEAAQINAKEERKRADDLQQKQLEQWAKSEEARISAREETRQQLANSRSEIKGDMDAFFRGVEGQVQRVDGRIDDIDHVISTMREMIEAQAKEIEALKRKSRQQRN